MGGHGMARTLRQILGDLEQGDPGSFWELAQWLEEKAVREGLDSLSAPARAIYLADRFDAGMFRGGFDTLMRWDPGLDIMQMIPALEAIGAARTAQVVRDLASLFPGGIIPTDPAARLREFDCASAQLHKD